VIGDSHSIKILHFIFRLELMVPFLSDQWMKNSQHISAMDDDVLRSGLC
jgi:hypothetical protein